MRPTRAAARLRSAPAAFAVALLLALAAAGTQGVVLHRDRVPAAGRPAGVGEAVQLGGAEVVVRSITVAPALPAAEAGDPAVRGPAGSVLVLVVFTQRVDATVDRATHTCTSSLVADDGSVWETDDTVGYALRRPEALICGDTTSTPLRPGALREIGASFLIPQRYAGQVRWRLSLDDDRYLVEVRP